ncbi:MAG: peptidylprolyl isomerase [Lactobacillales bacterium]|jgi:foldase protein PrsA|nr:peptidylprolyl isomerase [Lactobacillales bacterium]
MIRKKIVLGATSALTILSLTGCGSKKIATMKGKSITVEDFYNEVKSTQTGQQTAMELIIFDAFEKVYGDKVKEADVTKAYDEAKKQAGDSFNDELKQRGLTQTSFKNQIRKKLAFQKGKEANVKVNEKEIKEVWKTYHPEVSIQWIVLDDKQTAETVLKDVQAEGSDFAKIAKEKSTDTETKSKGGNLKFDSTSTIVPEEVKTASYPLKDGQTSGIIEASSQTSAYTAAAPTAPKFYLVKMIKNKSKGKSLTPYKKTLEKIAKDKQLNDSEFVKKVILKLIKDENVKIVDSAFDNVLSQFTGESNESKKSSSKKAKSSSKVKSSKAKDSSSSSK